ncbi:tetratricopeptide repeat protein [bacterium]|nr:tetratricopeptide repeat protein [bacterium]
MIIQRIPYLAKWAQAWKLLTSGYWFGTDYQFLFFRPLTTLSYILNYQSSGLNSTGYHLFNIILHALNTYLIYALVIRLKNRRLAVLSALIFAVYPIAVPSAAYISGRSEALAFLFLALAALFYLRGGFGFIKWALPLLFFTLALFSSETAWIFPLFLLPFLIKRREGLYVILFLLLEVMYFILRIKMLGDWNYGSAKDFAGWSTAFASYYYYLKTILFPYIYQHAATVSTESPAIGLGALGALILIIISILRKKVGDAVSIGAWTILTVLLIPSNMLGTKHELSVQALYIPSAGFALILSALIVKIISGKSAAVRIIFSYVFSIIIIIFTAFSFMQARSFRSETALWASAVRSNPNSAVAHHNLGMLLLDMKMTNEAMSELRRAVELDPEDIPGQRELARLFWNTGQYEKAYEEMENLIRKVPDSTEDLLLLGRICNKLKRYYRSIDVLTRANKLDPKLERAAFELGIANYYLMNREDAVKYFTEATITDKTDVEYAYYYRAKTYIAMGKDKLALLDYQKAIEINPKMNHSNSIKGTIYSLKKKMGIKD